MTAPAKVEIPTFCEYSQRVCDGKVYGWTQTKQGRRAWCSDHWHWMVDELSNQGRLTAYDVYPRQRVKFDVPEVAKVAPEPSQVSQDEKWLMAACNAAPFRGVEGKWDLGMTPDGKYVDSGSWWD